MIEQLQKLVEALLGAFLLVLGVSWYARKKEKFDKKTIEEKKNEIDNRIKSESIEQLASESSQRIYDKIDKPE